MSDTITPTTEAPTTTVKRGRGRPRTKPLTRLDNGRYESQDGRFKITGIGKRGRFQEFVVQDYALPESAREDEEFVASNLEQIVTILSMEAPESLGMTPESIN